MIVSLFVPWEEVFSSYDILAAGERRVAKCLQVLPTVYTVAFSMVIIITLYNPFAIRLYLRRLARRSLPISSKMLSRSRLA